MKEKRQGKSPSAFGRLMVYAGRYKTLTYLSLIPFVCLWRIIREVLEVLCFFRILIQAHDLKTMCPDAYS